MFENVLTCCSGAWRIRRSRCSKIVPRPAQCLWRPIQELYVCAVRRIIYSKYFLQVLQVYIAWNPMIERHPAEMNNLCPVKKICWTNSEEVQWPRSQFVLWPVRTPKKSVPRKAATSDMGSGLGHWSVMKQNKTSSAMVNSIIFDVFFLVAQWCQHQIACWNLESKKL